MSYKNIPEEELKSRVGEDYFSDYDCKKIIGKVDFCVLPKKDRNQTELFREQSLLWAEAKANQRNSIEMFAQLILTIGKARTFSQHLPPAFLGVFDAEKIAFVPYEKVSDLFYKNDFNWNVAPSNHTTKEFAEIKSLINETLEREKYLYYFGKDDKLLKIFIKQNLAKGTEENKIQIDVNNFKWIFEDWIEKIKPLIDYSFDKDKQQRILDLNFFLADLFVDDKNTTTIDDDEPINEDIFVMFRNGRYEIDKEKAQTLFKNELFDVGTLKYEIKDKTAYENFWKHYKRPPNKISQNLILERKDLLVSDDVRERKGAFFTPKQWVRLSQKYIADVLGENWQQEYYVWDCCAGTGNLLDGLTNKYNIYASTLDQGDVQVMKGQANLLNVHVFQFDFLNDDFFDKYRIIKSKKYIDKIITDDGTHEISLDKSKITIDEKTYELELVEKSKLPQSLQSILKNPEKRKKLVVYINPPYAEEGSKPGRTGKKDVQISRIHQKYSKELRQAKKELFAQFLIRIYYEIPNSVIANFSKLKNLQSPNFSDFRKNFRAKLEKIFLVPAKTFDNVNGSFPVGFFVWDTKKKEEFTQITGSVYEPYIPPKTKSKDFVARQNGTKTIFGYDGLQYINEWIASFDYKSTKKRIGFLSKNKCGNSFQHNNLICLTAVNNQSHYFNGILVYFQNIITIAVYMSVRQTISSTWLNDRDQFLYPKDSWQNDIEFHNDCLAFTLFHGQNRITSKEGINHWIPFTEAEVNAQERFASHFMSDFINGKIKIKTEQNASELPFEPTPSEQKYYPKRKFSPEAQAVFDAGRELWRYYHSQKYDVNPNASLYDIREYFQGRNPKTQRMNNTSTDQKYNELMRVLREKLKILADKIAEKVYLHGFLKG